MMTKQHFKSVIDGAFFGYLIAPNMTREQLTPILDCLMSSLHGYNDKFSLTAWEKYVQEWDQWLADVPATSGEKFGKVQARKKEEIINNE